MTEIWKPVVGYAGYYEISNKGRVRSYNRTVKGDRNGSFELKGRVLTSSPRNKYGHLRVTLCVDGKEHGISIHKLVLEAFVGPCPLGMECRHLDGNPTNNCWPENICWGTKQENRDDMIIHNTVNKGSARPAAKLDEGRARKIYNLANEGTPIALLASQFDISKTTVKRIKAGLAWKHVIGD